MGSCVWKRCHQAIGIDAGLCCAKVSRFVISLEVFRLMALWFQKWEPGKRERERRLKKALAEAAANPEPPPNETLDKGFASIPEGKT